MPLRVLPAPGGGLLVRIPADEAEAIRALPDRMRAVLENPDARDRVIRRLFPGASRDEAVETEYRRLLGDDLRRRKREAIEVFERTLKGWKKTWRRVEVSIRPEDFSLWLEFVNDMRLVIGTLLGIERDGWSEEPFDPDSPDAPEWALLHTLSWLEEQLLSASGQPGLGLGPDDVRPA